MARIHTDANKLKAYLHKIKKSPSDLCECGETQDLPHVLFKCPLQEPHRPILQGLDKPPMELKVRFLIATELPF